MNRQASIALFLTLVFFSAALATPAWAVEETLTTRTVLMVGYPSEGEADEGVLIVPGTVIPLPKDLAYKPGVGMVEAEQGRTLELVETATRLRDSLRLENVVIQYQLALDLVVEEKRSLPAPTAESDVRIEVELLGYNEHYATFAVQFFDRSAVIADTKVTAVRGQRTLVGGLDGEETPYLFLMLEPVTEQAGKSPIHVTDDVTPPRVIEKVLPTYPEKARKEGVEGTVVVQVVIDEKGNVGKAEILKTLPYGLAESAAETVQKWRFEPALLDGEPVAVIYNLTINFRLADKKKDE